MSPGIGMPELVVVLVLALVVVGPQQLPVMMRKVGQIMAQARAMAREFQNSFEEIGRETELAELRKEIEALKKSNPIEEIRGEMNRIGQDARDVENTIRKDVDNSGKTAPAKSAPALPAEDAAGEDRLEGGGRDRAS